MSRYHSGLAREYKVKEEFEKDGYIVLRSAGSHGFADLVAIHPTKKKIFFIQVKPSSHPMSEAKKDMDKFKWLDDKFDCKFMYSFVSSYRRKKK